MNPHSKAFYFLPVLLTFTFLLLTSSIHADNVDCNSLDECAAKIADLSKSLQLSVSATKPLEGQVSALKIQLAQIQANLDRLSASIAQKQKSLDIREDKLALQQALLQKRVKQYYIRSFLTDPLTVILSSISSGNIFQELSYRQSVTREDQQIIISITGEVVGLLQDKQNLEKDQAKLASLQAEVDKNAAFLGGEIKKAKAYQSILNSQIAQLSAKQQEIIAAKQASLGLPTSAYTSAPACIDDRGVDPGFSPALAFFTYGVPNRVGLNQYGAWGRARAGKSAEDILSAYYPGITLKKDYDTGATINVNGYGPYNVEDYVKRIYEMPASWTDNDSAALKAQAVAARSYGLARRGGICSTDSCQVFKPDPKTDNNNAWINAVDATKGWVLVDGGGNPVSTQYSSTHGGYILNLNRFDGEGGSPTSFADLNARAYDGPSHANSPWFYCDWGSRAQYNKTAWLQGSEVADIVNVLLLVSKDSSTRDHLYQVDKPNPAGTDTWDAGRVRQELSSRGGTPFSSVSSVSVSADFSGGRTGSVSISGDGGTVSFAGSDFKNWFDLRAPANIQIVGPLFNVEHK